MRNKISIDELVRQKVAQGKEPHNLGSWANMERMLNGDNPYEQENKRNRKPWLFMLIGLLITGSAVVGSYMYINNNTSKNKNSLLAINKSQSALLANHKSEAATTNSAAIVEDNAPLDVEQINNNEVLLASTNQTAVIQSMQPAITPQSKTKSNNQNYESNTLPLAKETLAQYNQTDNDHAQLNVTTPKTTKDNTTEVANISKNKKTLGEEVPPTIEEKYIDTVQVTEISNKLKKDMAGNEYYVPDSFKYKLLREKTRTVINPRYVALTKEQEEAAQRLTATTSLVSEVSAKPNHLFDENTTNKIAQNAKTNIDSKTQAREKVQFFELFKSISSALKQKSIYLSQARIPIYSGMFLGVNTAFIKSSHNFGGFQGGFFAMTPLSKRLSLRTEARFIHQRNGGYTITDNKHIIKNVYIDSTSVFKNKIYNYTIDSIGYGYNLQNFYSIQLPILINASINKFDVYGGINMNYGFPMNIVTTAKSHLININDTISSAQIYTPRSGSEAKYTRSDFASRLGIGYTVGGAYNFNPNLYLDIRMSNQIWDNGVTQAQKDISNVFFKIPSFQLSVGYRFRKYGK